MRGTRDRDGPDDKACRICSRDIGGPIVTTKNQPSGSVLQGSPYRIVSALSGGRLNARHDDDKRDRDSTATRNYDFDERKTE